MMSLRTSYYILLDPSHCCNENITICMIRLVEKWIQLLNLAYGGIFGVHSMLKY